MEIQGGNASPFHSIATLDALPSGRVTYIELFEQLSTAVAICVCSFKNVHTFSVIPIGVDVQGGELRERRNCVSLLQQIRSPSPSLRACKTDLQGGVVTKTCCWIEAAPGLSLETKSLKPHV
jgi:hypothetical protein